MLLGKFENLGTKDKAPIFIKDGRGGTAYTFCKSLYIRMEYYTLVLRIPNDNDFYFSLVGGIDNNKSFVDSRNFLLDAIKRTFKGQMLVVGISAGAKGANPGNTVSMMQVTSPINMMEVFIKGVDIETCSVYLRLKEKLSNNCTYSLSITFTAKREGNLNFRTYQDCKINVRLRMNKRYKKELYNAG